MSKSWRRKDDAEDSEEEDIKDLEEGDVDNTEDELWKRVIPKYPDAFTKGALGLAEAATVHEESAQNLTRNNI